MHKTVLKCATWRIYFIDNTPNVTNECQVIQYEQEECGQQ